MSFKITGRLQVLPPTSGEMSKVISSLNRHLSNVKVDIQVDDNGLRQIKKQLGYINQQQGKFNTGQKESVSLMQDFADKTKLAFKRYSAFVIGTTGILKLASTITEAVKSSIELETELRKVAQVTDSALDSTKGLKSQILDLSAAYGVSSVEIAKSARLLRQSDISARDTSKAIEVLAKTTLAGTFDDIATSTEDVIAIMKQFNGKVDIADAFDQINIAASKYAIEAADIGVATKKAGGVFAAAGGNFQEFIAIVTAVRDTTRESADTIGTALKTIVPRLQRGSVQDVLKKYGIDLLNDKGNFIGPLLAFEEIDRVVSKIDSKSGAFADIAQAIGGFRQVGKVTALITQFDKIKEVLGEVKNSGGAIDDDVAIALETIDVKVKRVNASFNRLFETFAGSNVIKTFFKQLLDATNSLLSILDKITKIPGVAEFGSAAAFAVGGGAVAKLSGGLLKALLTKNKSPLPFNRGGLIPGRGPNKDTVSAMLTKGEFVLNRKAVDNIGVDTLNRLNSPRGYVDGGLVDDEDTGRNKRRGKRQANRAGRRNFKQNLKIDLSGIQEISTLNKSIKKLSDIYKSETRNIERLKLTPPPLYPDSEKSTRRSNLFFAAKQEERKLLKALKGIGDISNVNVKPIEELVPLSREDVRNEKDRESFNRRRRAGTRPPSVVNEYPYSPGSNVPVNPDYRAGAPITKQEYYARHNRIKNRDLNGPTGARIVATPPKYSITPERRNQLLAKRIRLNKEKELNDPTPRLVPIPLTDKEKYGYREEITSSYHNIRPSTFTDADGNIKPQHTAPSGPYRVSPGNYLETGFSIQQNTLPDGSRGYLPAYSPLSGNEDGISQTSRRSRGEYRKAGIDTNRGSFRRTRAAARRFSNDITLGNTGTLIGQGFRETKGYFGNKFFGHPGGPSGGSNSRFRNLPGAISQGAGSGFNSLLGIRGLLAYGAYSAGSSRQQSGLENIQNRSALQADVDNALLARKKGAGVAGLIAGGSIGSGIGGGIGSLFGPAGTALGKVAGGAIGGFTGAIAGISTDFAGVRDVLKSVTFGLIDYETSQEALDKVNQKLEESMNAELKALNDAREAREKSESIQNRLNTAQLAYLNNLIQINDATSRYSSAIEQSNNILDNVDNFQVGRNSGVFERAQSGTIVGGELDTLLKSLRTLNIGGDFIDDGIIKEAFSEAKFNKGLLGAVTSTSADAPLTQDAAIKSFDNALKAIPGLNTSKDSVVIEKLASKFAAIIDSDVQGGGVLETLSPLNVQSLTEELKKEIGSNIEAAKLMYGFVADFQNSIMSMNEAIIEADSVFRESLSNIEGQGFDVFSKIKDFSKDRSSIADAIRAKNNQVALVSGGGTTSSLSSSANTAKQNINAIQTKITANGGLENNTTRNDRADLVYFKTQLSKATAGLKELSDTSRELNAIESELARERSKREVAAGIAQDFTFGSNADRREQQRIERAANTALSTGSIDSVRQQDRAGVRDYFEKFSGVEDARFGNNATTGRFNTGQDVIDRLTKNKTGVSNDLSSSEKTLILQYERIAKDGLKAQEELSKLNNNSVQMALAIQDATMAFNNAVQNQATLIQQLNQGINNIPSSINGNITHNVKIEMNGLQVLKEIEPGIAALVVSYTEKAINQYNKENHPDIPNFRMNGVG